MKPRNTRIKVVEKFDGHKKYMLHIPQHRDFFGTWYNFSDFRGYSCMAHTNPYSYRLEGSSLAIAKEQIDDYIKAWHREDRRRKGKDIIKVEYVDYP